MASPETNRKRATALLATVGGAAAVVFAMSVGAVEQGRQQTVETSDPNKCVFITYVYEGVERHFPVAAYLAPSVLEEVNKGNISVLTNEIICNDIENQGTVTTPQSKEEKASQPAAEITPDQAVVEELKQLDIGAILTVMSEGNQYLVVKVNQKIFRIQNTEWYAKKILPIEEITSIVR